MKKRILIGVGVLLVVLIAVAAIALFVYPKAQILNATHQPAPDFTLKDAEGKNFTLSSLRGRNVVLYFYRGYW
jgi:cytochrome oxidase Cu insertion factor (SCO1/SenC/PrrC family)